MPRCGWIFDEDLSQVLWRQFLRGPRPPSVQRPRRNVSAVDGQRPAKKGKGKGQFKGAGGNSDGTKVPARRRVRLRSRVAEVLQSRLQKAARGLSVYKQPSRGSVSPGGIEKGEAGSVPRPG